MRCRRASSAALAFEQDLERNLLTMLIQSYPTVLTDEELADATGYSPGGGAFNNPKGRLRSLGLITYPSAKASKAADLLFLAEGT